MTLPAPGGADEVVVRDSPEQNRYQVFVDDALAGFAEYDAQPGLITVLLTEVDPAFEGRGVGSDLVRGMLEDIRRRDARGASDLPFVRAFLQRHPEYADLVWKP